MVGSSRPKRRIIAIDGPSGAGKSTVGKCLAKRLGYTYIDTGAMYRAVALKARERAIPPEDEVALSQLASSLRITFRTHCGESLVFCDGEEITEAIRQPEISLLASHVSKSRGVREALVRMQREMGRQGGVVLDGRDIGTVVFPKADLKFYLDAHPEERASRRFNELLGKGVRADFKETLDDVLKRDHNDMTRPISPLRKAEDAVTIDSTGLTVDQVVERMAQVVLSMGG